MKEVRAEQPQQQVTAAQPGHGGNDMAGDPDGRAAEKTH